MDDDATDETGTPWYIWLGLSVTAAVSFWVQATVTEERTCDDTLYRF